eukprot:scaffold258621_cov21-Tisochrysis_lutea.AAC.1
MQVDPKTGTPTLFYTGEVQAWQDVFAHGCNQVSNKFNKSMHQACLNPVTHITSWRGHGVPT